MTIQDIRDILVSTGIKVCHFDSDLLSVPYIVFSESRESDDYAGDNTKIEQSIIVNVYYVTPHEYDGQVNDIQAAFVDAGLSFRLISIEYIREAKRIQYSWTIDLLTSPEAIYGDT